MRNPMLMSALVALALAIAPAQAQTGVATVDFEDQTSDGHSVVVASASLSNGGFVVIHNDTLLDGDGVGSVIGVSAFLEAGIHTDIRINVTDLPEGNTTLIAMPHFDSNDNEEYDFVTSNGTDDGPYTQGGAAVTDDAHVTSEGEVVDDEDDAEDDRGFGDDDGDGRGAPGFEIVAGLAGLAAVAMILRRR